MRTLLYINISIYCFLNMVSGCGIPAADSIYYWLSDFEEGILNE
jgi:hypothetical protein